MRLESQVAMDLCPIHDGDEEPWFGRGASAHTFRSNNALMPGRLWADGMALTRQVRRTRRWLTETFGWVLERD
jgi:hypothetical protein